MKEKIFERVELPEGINASVEGMELSISGKALEKKIFKAKGISLRKENNSIIIEASSANKRSNAMLRSIKKHIENMVEGVKKGYSYKLAIVYSHFPINAQVKGNIVEIYNFLGEKKPRIAKIIGNTRVEVKGKEIIVSGSNKEHAGQTAGNLETITRVVGKDRRIYQDGIFIQEKSLIRGE